MSTSLQVIKSTMLETVHQWINATMMKQTRVSPGQLFQEFTGSDSTFSFKFKDRRAAVGVRVSFLIEKCATIVNTQLPSSPRLKEVASNFVCRLYSNSSNKDNDFDLVRLRLFSQKTRDVERIPPTSGALG